MKALYFDLKSRYNKADINLTNDEMIEIHFSKAIEPIIIQKGLTADRFIVSYPKLTLLHNEKRDEYVTGHNILLEGLLWILKKVKQNGKVVS